MNRLNIEKVGLASGIFLAVIYWLYREKILHWPEINGKASVKLDAVQIDFAAVDKG